MKMVIHCFQGMKQALKECVTPHHKMTGCYPRSCRRILDETRIHKYTHTNHKLSAINIKYYKFSLNFDT
jgi:hypothetical protein